MAEIFIQLSIKRPTDIGAGCALLAGKQQAVCRLRPDSNSSRDLGSRKVYPRENWAILKKMGASINLENNIATVSGVKKLSGKNLKGSDLRSTAAIVIAALTADNSSLVEGLEHLDRGYEDFEFKLKKLGADIKRDLTINSSKNSYNDDYFMNEVQKIYAA